MRLTFLIFLTFPFWVFSEPSQPQSDEEALFLRRIADFWEEGDYSLAKNQMENFLNQYPESGFSEILCMALGDLYLREKNYQGAIECYARVNAPEFFERSLLNRMQCLYHMQWYPTLADECEKSLQNQSLAPNQKLQTTYYLALALYQQCLNAAKNPEMLEQLASRAEPYFETLFQSELSEDIAQAFAHLCCILKDFPKASQIYLNLARANPESEEELLFQAAVIQAEFDKEMARETFGHIASLGQKRSKEAAYNQLVLTFDAGRHEEVVESKEKLMQETSPEKEGMVRLFLARSLMALQKFPEASAELLAFIQDAPPSETLHSALICLLEASSKSADLNALNQAIEKLTALDPQDEELPKAYLSRIQLLKSRDALCEARADVRYLLKTFPDFPERAEAAFELAHLDYKAQSWTSCREAAHAFLAQFPQHKLSPYVWGYLLSASTELAAENSQEKERLVADLQTFFAQNEQLPASEKSDWQYLLAKTQYERGFSDEAVRLVSDLFEEPVPFAQEGNAHLLLGLCAKDRGDSERFIQEAERALSLKADLLELGQIHALLFNAYSVGEEEGKLDRTALAAEHLYLAFEAKADVQLENLLWLSDFYLAQMPEGDLLLTQRTISLLEKILEYTPDAETTVSQLAKLYTSLSRTEQAISLLENFLQTHPSSSEEAQLALAESYLRLGEEPKAKPLLEAILSSGAAPRSPIRAAASLQNARIQFAESLQSSSEANGEALAKVLSDLKDLVLQRSLVNEPTHLEAALDYIDFQGKLSKTPEAEKKLALLLRTKADFEQSNDLLSKDYQEARIAYPAKDKIYQGYMHLIEAEIFALKAELSQESLQQKELQGKAKDLLLQIVNEQVHPALVGRARQKLNHIASADEPKLESET
jgi:TolA-binding protein